MNLRRELRMKFEEVLISESRGEPTFNIIESIPSLAELLADAALEVSGIAKRTDETAEDYNVELFRGDWRDYPERLWKIAECLRDVWMFRLPAKPQKKSKGDYAFYVQSMDLLKDACGEFGTDALVKVHEDWKAKFKDGIAPYTVAQPTSLINPVSGKAREMREKIAVKETDQPKAFPTLVNGRLVQ